MKLHPECIPCLFERANFECNLAFGGDEKGKIKAMAEVAQFAAENINSSTVPALIGTMRGRIISRSSGIKDPYKELKNESNKAGLEVLHVAKKYYESVDDKTLALMKIAAAANSMEYGVRGHVFNEKKFKPEFRTILDEEVFGDLKGAKKLFTRFKRVLYLLDNAGEAVLDRFVVEQLEEMGLDVTVSPKSEPVINDVTMKEAEKLGFKADKMVASGSFVGVSLEESPKDFLDVLFDPGVLVVAKGMGNYETISEFEERLQGRLIYIFRAKCISVALNAGVDRGALGITSV